MRGCRSGTSVRQAAGDKGGGGAHGTLGWVGGGQSGSSDRGNPSVMCCSQRLKLELGIG
jgi:hypothetical protein